MDFDDPEVQAAIEKAAREYRHSPEVLRELAKYEPTVPTGQTMMTVLP